jgi:hypothetical protein
VLGIEGSLKSADIGSVPFPGKTLGTDVELLTPCPPADMWEGEGDLKSAGIGDELGVLGSDRNSNADAEFRTPSLLLQAVVREEGRGSGVGSLLVLKSADISRPWLLDLDKNSGTDNRVSFSLP